jgi:YD repeat-containing protein
MKQRYLEITYRKGKPLAAYLYLPRPLGATSVKTEDAGSGMRVDYDAAGNPIGVELTAPSAVSLEDISELLTRLGQTRLGSDEWAPLAVA